MTRLRVGVIGTGRKKDRPDITGFFMAYQHAAGYQALPDQCELVACADIVPENAQAFAAATGIPAEGVFTDYHAMLAEADLDVVSVCTWPHLHAPMVLDCTVAGVRAVHCEKPMADSWGAARLMAQECERRGVQLTFNHMWRFGAPFARARDLLRSGAIGDLVRVETGFNGDIYDTGTHYIDMCGFFVGDQPVEWVIGQVDYRAERRIFGAHAENQTLGSWRYRNGVYGVVATGTGAALVGVTHRLNGTDGTIEVGVHDGPLLRVRGPGSATWEVVDTGEETLHGPGFHERGIADLVEALRTGREPELSARRALNATEIIFGIYESSRRRGRVDLPLTIMDHPLAAMVEAGELRPAPVL
jgi:UDP-N-acetylglucosamine 3-dehydrogenase